MILNREILSAFLKRQMSLTEPKAALVSDVLSAMDSGHHLLLKYDAASAESYSTYVIATLKTNIMDPLAKEIEADLRLQVHAHLGVDRRSPLKSSSWRDPSSLLSIEPFHFDKRRINVKRYIESYLNSVFYRFTALSSHDWLSYMMMRDIALEKYGLNLLPVYLPSGTIEQSMDLADIMRQLPEFFRRYNYSLNQQMFIESQSAGAYLNTLGSIQVVNFLKKHGSGIVKTAVDLTYQHLKTQVGSLNLMVFDDYVQSCLVREGRFYKENGMRYAFGRWGTVSEAIKKFGSDSQGEDYFDRFTQVITSIGNAIAFVRMLRVGELDGARDTMQFIPDWVRNYESQESTENSHTILSSVVKQLNLIYDDANDYVDMLVKVFSSNFASSSPPHLSFFFLLLPALINDFCEKFARVREESEKGRTEPNGSFTQDGFVLGLAYVLRVFNQVDQFKSLLVFDIARRHYGKSSGSVPSSPSLPSKSRNASRSKISRPSSRDSLSKIPVKDDEEQTQGLRSWMSQRAANAVLAEFELLECTLDCALMILSPKKK